MSNRGFLETIDFPTPCDADWERMSGGDQKRFCQQCGKDVYNISAMKRREAKKLTSQNAGKICIRLQRTPDGRVLTATPSSNQVSNRPTLIAAGIFSSLLSFVPALGQERPAGNATAVIKKDPAKKSCQVSFTVVDPTGAPIPGATVELKNLKQEYTSSTDSNGVATFALVRAGLYDMRAESKYFKTYTTTLTIKQPLEPNVRIVLEVGSVTGIFIVNDSDLPMFQAITQGNIQPIENAVRSGFDINTKDRRGRTALHIAVENGELELVRFLLDNGAKVNVRDKNNLTPILMIEGYDDDSEKEIFSLLLEKRADVNVLDQDGESLLMRACGDEELEIVKLLLKHGADVNKKDRDGETAIEKTNSAEIKRLLTAAGARPKN